MAILDLTQFEVKYMEMKMLDGSMLNLKQPTQGFLLNMMSFEEKVKANKKSPEKLLGIMLDYVVLVLNYNKEGRVFEAKDLEDGYSFEIQMAIIKGYSEWLGELNSAKN